MLTLAFAAYLAVVACIAWVAWRRTRTVGDYLIGGRRVPAWIAALSAGASDMSGWLLLGLPGLAVVAPGAACWTGVGLLLGTWLNWRFVAGPLREASERHDALTVPQLLERQLHGRRGVVSGLAALCIVAFFLFYTSAGLVAGGKLFATVFGWPYATSVVTGAVVIAAYTLFGGFLAVAWTDALQALMMIVALTIVAALLLAGDGATAAGTWAQPGGLAIASALAWGLGYAGQPHILARFMAIEHVRSVPRARRIAVSWTAVSLAAAVAVGFGGRALLPEGTDPERVFMVAIELLLNPWVAGFALAAILAAIMSTADSQLLVTASALAEDLLPRLGRAVAPEGRRMLHGRFAVLGTCAAATALALDPRAGVLELVAHAWAGFGATIGPALIVALYVRGATVASTVAGLLAGAGAVALWSLRDDGWFELYALLPGFAAGLTANLVTLQCQRVLRRRKADVEAAGGTLGSRRRG